MGEKETMSGEALRAKSDMSSSGLQNNPMYSERESPSKASDGPTSARIDDDSDDGNERVLSLHGLPPGTAFPDPPGGLATGGDGSAESAINSSHSNIKNQ